MMTLIFTSHSQQYGIAMLEHKLITLGRKRKSEPRLPVGLGKNVFQRDDKSQICKNKLHNKCEVGRSEE